MPNRPCFCRRLPPQLTLTALAAALLWPLAAPLRAEPMTLDLTRLYRPTPHEKIKPALGRQTVDGLPFEIGGEAILYGRTQAEQNRDETYRETFEAVPVGRKFDELHLIHATRWPDAEGRPVAFIRFKYADGTNAEVPIRYGGHVRDWQRLPTEEHETLTDADSKIFWRGPGIRSFNSTSRLFKSILRNPFPAKTVVSLDVVSAKNLAAYTLLAATVAERDPKRPITPPAPPDEPPRHFDATLVIRVVDEASGKPLEAALVNPLNITVDKAGVVASPMYTPASGEVVIRYPRGGRNVVVAVRKDGYATQAKRWAEDVPAEHTFRLGAVIRDERAKAFFDRAMAKYRSLKTYQDKANLRYEIKSDTENARRSWQRSATLAFARPNRIALLADDISLVCDGEHLRVSLPSFGQYRECAASETVSLPEALPTAMFPRIATHPVALMLTEPNADFSKLFPAITRLKDVVAETRHGEAGHRVFGALGGGDDEQPAEIVSFWFSDATGLLREMTVDFTETYRRSIAESAMSDEEHKPPKIEKAEVVLSLDDVVLDADIPAERFAFKPEANTKKVARFDLADRDQSRQMELLGTPAPEISGQDLDGQPVSLAAWRGRVVMLDFWATWCGPCLQALPHVQKLAEKFADKPVTVLGINCDPAGSDEKLKKFLERKKISIRQLPDLDGHASQQYRVHAIPCTVLIGTNGVIQAIEVGFRGEDSLAEEIERLLQGETLFDASQVKPATEPVAQPTGGETDVALEELAGESFVEQSAVAGSFVGAGYQARWFDLDGNGRPQLVLKEWGSGLAIVSADGTQVKHVRLQDLAEGNLASFEPVRLDGRLHWLVGVSQWIREPAGDGSPASVRLYDADGNLLWNHQPQTGEGVSCELKASAGDLFGDGKTEVAVSVHAYRLRKSGANFYRQEQSRAYLEVLDASGKLLARHRIGENVEFIHVFPAERGKPATVLCVADGKLRRFQVKSPAAVRAGATAP